MMSIDQRLTALAIYEGVVHVSLSKRFRVAFAEGFRKAFQETFGRERKKA